MNNRDIRNLGSIKGNLSFNEPLKKYTSLKVGGPAEIFFQPYDLKELKLFSLNLVLVQQAIFLWQPHKLMEKLKF